MNTEKEFYEELARGVPALPLDIYTGVRASIRNQKVLVRTLVSLAATLALAIGITVALGSGSHGSLQAEVVSELQSLCDYGSGSDISNDLETYALYEGEISH